MKKALFIMLAIMFGLVVDTQAQTYKFYSTDFAFRMKDQDGYWTELSEWHPSRCLVTLSLDRNIINIYSEEPQEFDIYDEVGEDEDNNGGISFTLCCIDADGLRCHIKIRRQKNDILQMYIEYGDLIYVYCLEERN